MADAQLTRLESFRTFIKSAEGGGTVPPVAKEDIKALHEISVEMAKRRLGKDGVADLSTMARACSPGADLPAVWFRYTRLRALAKQGLLKVWQHNTEFDEAVFDVAATIPINGFQVDSDEFLRRLGQKGQKLSAVR